MKKIAIKNWFLEKNNMKGFYGKDITVVKETAKAVLVHVDGFFTNEWIPKSVLVDEWEKDTSNFGYHDYLVETYLKNGGENEYIHQQTTKFITEVLKRYNITFMSRTEWNNR